jgi:pilus assembly protein CpaE
MKDRPIRVLIADDSALSRHMMSQLILAQPDLEIVGSAADGREAVRLATDLQPDVVLMDIHMPDIDGIQAAWLFSSKVPHGSVIMVTVEDRPDFVQKALAAGASGYVTKPLGDGSQLVSTIREVYRAASGRQLDPAEPGGDAPTGDGPPGKKIAIFGSKGGVGKTTLAVSLALALQQHSNRNVALVDADFMFGDCATHLDLEVEHTIVDLLPYIPILDGRLLDQVLERHSSGLRLLAPPLRPEQADILKAEHVRSLIGALTMLHDYVIIDTQPSYDERMLAVLDLADVNLIVLPSQLGALKNTRHFLDVAKVLGFPDERMAFVLNRANSLAGLSIEDIRTVLGQREIFEIPSAGVAQSEAINYGVPLYLLAR